MLMSLPTRASICLRCQLRLARQALGPERRDVVRRTFATSSCVADERYSGNPAGTGGSRQQRGRSKGVKRIHPHGRIRGRPGDEVREDSAKLSVNSLGKPAEIIILREAPVRMPDPAPEKEEEEDEPPDEPKTEREISGSDILADIQTEGKRESTETINRRIEEIRPDAAPESSVGGLQPIPLKDYRRLVKALSRGFVGKQLDSYMKVNTPITRQEVYLLSDKASGVVAPWRPETKSTMISRLATIWRPWKRHAHMRVTEKKAHQIVTDYWGFSSFNEGAVEEGQLEIHHMTQRDFQALTSGDHSQLRTVAEQHNVKIEVLQSTAVLGGNIVRITGPQEDSQAALDHIRKFIRTLTLEVLDLKQLVAVKATGFGNFFKGTAPDAMSRVHKIFEQRKNILKNSISQIASDITGIAVDVRPKERFALNIVNEQQSQDTAQALIASINIPTPMKILPNATSSREAKAVQQGVYWRDNLPLILSARVCSRLTTAIKQAHDGDAEIEATPSMTAVEGSLNSIIKRKGFELQDQVTPISQSMWYPWKLHTSASLGRLLWLNETKKDVSAIKKPKEIAVEDLDMHYFQDMAPGLLNAAPHLTFDEPLGPGKIVFRLLIDPSKVPLRRMDSELQISMDIGRTADNEPIAEVDSIRLIARRFDWAQPFPDRTTDLHLQHDLAMDLKLDMLQDEQLEGLNRFVEACKQSIVTPGPIRAPADVEVCLPKHATDILAVVRPSVMNRIVKKMAKEVTAREASASSILPSSADGAFDSAAAAPDELSSHLEPSSPAATDPPNTDISFMLAHIEHHQTRKGRFAGHQLIHFSRDGGRLGGKGTTLRLVKSYDMTFKADGSIKWPKQEIVESQKSMLTSAGRLSWLLDNVVRGKGWLGQGSESRNESSDMSESAAVVEEEEPSHYKDTEQESPRISSGAGG